MLESGLYNRCHSRPPITTWKIMTLAATAATATCSQTSFHTHYTFMINIYLPQNVHPYPRIIVCSHVFSIIISIMITRKSKTAHQIRRDANPTSASIHAYTHTHTPSERKRKTRRGKKVPTKHIVTFDGTNIHLLKFFNQSSKNNGTAHVAFGTYT